MTPEPVPQKAPSGRGGRRKTARPRFVIQEHHARALHWDFRLEHDGVLVSWAIPKGLPLDKKSNHLAVHTEDHPLEYGSFEGTIPEGEYGGGQVILWDVGTYDEIKWSDREVMVVLHGKKAEGQYVLFATGAGREKGRRRAGAGLDGAPDGRAARRLRTPPRRSPAHAGRGRDPAPGRRRLGLRVQMGRDPGHQSMSTAVGSGSCRATATT